MHLLHPKALALEQERIRAEQERIQAETAARREAKLRQVSVHGCDLAKACSLFSYFNL